jgi:hypothetical protein
VNPEDNVISNVAKRPKLGHGGFLPQPNLGLNALYPGTNQDRTFPEMVLEGELTEMWQSC